MIMKNVRKSLPLLLAIVFIFAAKISMAADFTGNAVISTMDSVLDGWYRIPSNSSPVINSVNTVYQDQVFNLYAIFKGYALDENKKAEIRYDVQIYDPKGQPTDDKGNGILAYQGPVKNPNQYLVANEFLKISFTEKYPLGRYKIVVTGHDMISNRTFTTARYVDLVSFTLSETFTSVKDASRWVMSYAASPSPVKAIDGLKHLVNPDLKWVDENLNTVFFFRQIFSDNPFLMKNISACFRSFSTSDKKRFILMAAVAGDSSLDPALPGDPDEKELRAYFKTVKKEVKFPDTKGDITSPNQLDILWAGFLATGKYESVKKIVDSFILKKYEGSLEKLQSADPLLVSDLMKKNALLEATFRSAVWSLTSNCKQIPLVLKYCTYMLEKEKLDKIVKDQLGTVLERVQKEKREARKPERSDV